MTRGELDRDTLSYLDRLVPEAITLQKRTLKLNPSFIEMGLGPKTDKGTAAVCLDDAADLLTEARFALHEAHAHWLWHSEPKNRSSSVSALFWSRFYLDDSLLRTYSAGESVGAFLYIEFGGPDLRRAGGQPTTHSRLLSAADRIKTAGHRDVLARKTMALVENPSWIFLKRYRDEWLHDQRPRLKGLGITYGRRPRWEHSSDGRTFSMTIGGGDPPRVTIEELFEHADEAYKGIRKLLSLSCGRLEQTLRAARSSTLGA
jgi:hypothetical protein